MKILFHLLIPGIEACKKWLYLVFPTKTCAGNHAEMSGGKAFILAGLEKNIDVNGRIVDMSTRRLRASWPSNYKNIYFEADECLYRDVGRRSKLMRRSRTICKSHLVQLLIYLFLRRTAILYRWA